jgi:hypothetical protein
VSDHPARLGPRFLTLACCDVRLGAWELDAEPRLYPLAAEDAAWQIAVADWRARRPGRWRRRARRRWEREALRHLAAGERLARLAADLGCATARRHVTLS